MITCEFHTTKVKTTRRVNMSKMCLVLVTITLTILASHISTANANNISPDGATKRVKRMYALCPPHFERVGTQCYYISDTQVNWLDAHFACKDRNSRLAEPIKAEDHRLRRFMVRNDKTHSTKWIGGMYNWQKNQWQWGYSGRTMDYQSFSQMVPGSSQDLKFHCSVLNANLKYRWSASPCAERHHFVCQHRMPYVSDKNRYKVYTKWNESFPNEMANEMEVVLEDQPRGRRRLSPKQVAESYNQVDLTDNTKAQTATRRPQNTNPQSNPQRRRKAHIFDKEMANGRFTNDPTRNVDFGAPKNNGMRRRRKHRTSTTTTTTSTTMTTTTTPSPPQQIDDNTLDINYEEKRRIEQDNQRRIKDAEWRAKHRQRQEEHRRKYLERKRKNEEERHQHQPTPETETTTMGSAPYQDYVTTASELSEIQIREKQRLAETRRLLGIEKIPGYQSLQTATATSTTVTVPHTTLPPVTIDLEEINILAEERRIRAEEERQRIEFEQQQLADQQAQEEARRQELKATELRRKEEQQKREHLESQRLIEERRVQEEERERQRLAQEQEEERIRLEEDKRIKEAQRLQQKQVAQMERQAKLDELKRLHEKSKVPMHDNETGTGEDPSSPHDARQIAALKKEKRDKLKAKLERMSPEMREEFFRRRNERNRKREANEIPAQ